MKHIFFTLLFAVAASMGISQAAVEINVDGNFEDWNAVDKMDLAEAIVGEDAYLKNLYKIMFCTNPEFIYFYIEWNGEKDMVDPLDLMIDTDNDAFTGYSSWCWANCGTDILIEGLLSEGYEYAVIYTFPEGVAQDEWTWNDIEATGAINVSSIKDLGNNHKAIEGSIMRGLLPPMQYLNVGVFAYSADWMLETGALPQITVGEEGKIPSPMLSVKLNNEAGPDNPGSATNKNISINYLDKQGNGLGGETMLFHFPTAPIIEGFTFVGWQPAAEIIDNRITLQAVYKAIDNAYVPAVVPVPGRKAQKLIRQGNLYILTDEKTYTVQGQEVR